MFSSLTLHDSLPILWTPVWRRIDLNQTAGTLVRYTAAARRKAHARAERVLTPSPPMQQAAGIRRARHRDRKSTRLNSSHLGISYAVFCLKKTKITK